MMQNKSVLNTDSFDRRRFKEILEMSKGLQKIRKEGRGILPSFPDLQADIWTSFYKAKPRLVDNVAPELSANRAIMERVMQEESYHRYRESTRLDDLTTAIATLHTSKETYEWLKQMTLVDPGMQQAVSDMAKKRKQSREETDKHAKEKLKQEIRAIEEEIKRMIRNKLETHDFGQHVGHALDQAKKTKESLKSLLSGIKEGSGEAELKKVPLRDQIALAEKLADHHKMKEIAEWAGRFKQIAKKKQKSKHRESMTRSGVEFGNNVERLLPTELAMYTHPATKLDFLRRFAEGQTMMFDRRGNETLGKGPIVFCLDQSGSMTHADTEAKGFALALMSIARKQRRDFALILFSTSAITIKFPKGKIAPNDMVELATTFLNGGTNFYAPLKQALDVIEESRFKKADLIFVTDGQASLPHTFVETFNERKNERQFNVLSVLLGHRDMYTVKLFSDEIVTAESFLDASDTAFEI